jgi:uncharacterized protein (DUF488 family)
MLSRKERAVLYLLKNTNKISKIKLVKLMFLVSEKVSFYNFIPYNYGPFSFELYHDLSHLEKEGYVSMNEESVSLKNRNIPPLDKNLGFLINEHFQKFLHYNDIQILDYTYSKHPEYTIFSHYDKRMSYSRDSIGIVTIGYEGKSIDSFLYELILNKVNMVLDVRKNAYSMKFGFLKNRLMNYLEKIGIEYTHMPELGIPSDQRKNLDTYLDYKALFADYDKELDGKTIYFERIKEIGTTKKIALMCFEKDAKYCHRGVIAERLRKDGIEVCNL